VTSDPAANRRLVLEAWNALDRDRDLTAIERFFAVDYVRHSSEGDYTREGLAKMLGGLFAGFPDLSTVTEDVICEADRVAYRWVSTGTHLGPYMGVPATHKRVVATGITISRFEEGLIAEDWASWNKVSVLHDLGIIPIS
jgi:steroid delta-isomerase-like uncharacterized protein